MTHESQQQDNWCWAACFRMACSFFGLQVGQQCVIAGRFLGQTGCCPPGNNADCDKTLDDTRIPTLYSSAGLTATTTTPFSDAAFQQALSQNRLVLLMLQFPSAFHFVLLSKFDSARGYIVDDPKYPAAFPATYGQIASAYGQGAIASAWTLGSQ